MRELLALQRDSLRKSLAERFPEEDFGAEIEQISRIEPLLELIRTALTVETAGRMHELLAEAARAD